MSVSRHFVHGRHLDVTDTGVRRIGIHFLAHSASKVAVGTEAWAGMGPHRHATWEIHWLRSGMMTWWSEAQGVFDLEPGWCHVIPPGVQHGSCTGVLQPGEIWWLQVAPDGIGGLDAATRSGITQALAALPTIFHAGAMLEPWQQLLSAVERLPPNAASPIDDLESIACLLRLLARVATGQNLQAFSPRMQRALTRAEEGQANVTALARAAKCSTPTLHRLFREEIGDSPAVWLKRRWIREACRRLRQEGESITAIALDLGFRSGQHFATRFRAYTGFTPTQYRETARIPPAQAVDQSVRH